MKDLGNPSPKVIKMITKDSCDILRLNEHPELTDYLWNTSEGDTFELEDIKLTTIYTPGHLRDHLCFKLE